jgi:hypothetical protein
MIRRSPVNIAKRIQSPWKPLQGIGGSDVARIAKTVLSGRTAQSEKRPFPPSM